MSKDQRLYRVAAHESTDWCHMCGNRADCLLDIWYPENAEAVLRGEGDPAKSNYIRICNSCVGVLELEMPGL